jgi:hypothetical protein
MITQTERGSNAKMQFRRTAADVVWLGIGVVLALCVSGSMQFVDASNVGSNVASGGTPAHACDDSHSSQCVANNAFHSIFDFNLTSGWRTGTTYAIGQYEPISSIDVVWDADSDADVLAYQANYGLNGLWAWTLCSGSAQHGGVDPDEWCRPQWLHYNLSYSQTASQKQSISCHEVGHTLGLRHSNETSGICMKRDQRTILVPSGHDVTMLNGQY